MLRIKSIDGRWCIVDGERVVANCGANKLFANQTVDLHALWQERLLGWERESEEIEGSEFYMQLYGEPDDRVEMSVETALTRSSPPTTWEAAVDFVLNEMRGVMVDRQNKYGPANIRDGGVHGLLTRITDKLARMKQDHEECTFFGECREREQVGDEKPDDAWLDLANYAGPIGLMLRRGWWELPRGGD